MNTTHRPARILEITSYPPPRAGWGIRVEFLKKRLEREGHQCVVLNTGTSREIPSTEYETVMGGADYLKKTWRFSRRGFLVHAHANGDAIKGVLLALVAEAINLVHGRRCILTFHAGAIQRYFPRHHAWWLVPVFWLLFTIPRRIVCNNDAVKQRIQGYGIPAAKIDVIPAFSREYLEFTPAALPEQLDAFYGRYPFVLFSYLRMRPLFYPLTLIEGFARLAQQRNDIGLVICGGMSHGEEGLQNDVLSAIARHRLDDRICFVEDLDHDAFLTVLQKSTLYLRTPITDGVASSVLESLALGVPVVACENGTRPGGVVTYPPTDAERLAETVNDVVTRRAHFVAALQSAELPDTLTAEIVLLTT